MSGLSIGSGDIIDVFAGGHLSQSTTQWLSQRNESLMGTVTAAAQNFFQQAQSMYNMVSTSDAMMLLRNLTTKSENTWSFDIVEARTLAEVQTANPFMQRWIMAQPDLRQRYLYQEVEGYGDSYVNYHGDAVGEAHHDYRRVMDGVVTHTEKEFGYKHYHDLLGEGERELTVFEKVDVLRTWARVAHMLEEGDDDPTSVTGAKL